MSAIDFSRSYMRWFSEANNVRIGLDAACTITDESSGKSETFYLIAPCRGEHTHGDSDLIITPGYEFAGVWAERESLIIRTHWASDRDNRSYREKDDTLDVRTFANTRQLSSNEEIYKATMESAEPLISRTTVRDEKRGLQAVMEYPINTMNVKEDPTRFQVDTGPLIMPDFDRKADRLIEQFEVAYVVYNRFDEAQFTLRKPVSLLGDNEPAHSTTDYSDIRIMPATNEVLIAVSG